MISQPQSKLLLQHPKPLFPPQQHKRMRIKNKELLFPHPQLLFDSHPHPLQLAAAKSLILFPPQIFISFTVYNMSLPKICALFFIFKNFSIGI